MGACSPNNKDALNGSETDSQSHLIEHLQRISSHEKKKKF